MAGSLSEPGGRDGVERDDQLWVAEITYIRLQAEFVYLADHNARFAREPAEPQDYSRKAPNAREREQVFCLETERSISNG